MIHQKECNLNYKMEKIKYKTLNLQVRCKNLKSTTSTNIYNY